MAIFLFLLQKLQFQSNCTLMNILAFGFRTFASECFFRCDFCTSFIQDGFEVYFSLFPIWGILFPPCRWQQLVCNYVQFGQGEMHIETVRFLGLKPLPHPQEITDNRRNAMGINVKRIVEDLDLIQWAFRIHPSSQLQKRKS